MTSAAEAPAILDSRAVHEAVLVRTPRGSTAAFVKSAPRPGSFTRSRKVSERRHRILRTVGGRHRCQLWCLPSGQTELCPPAEQQAGSDAMATANLGHGNAWLLGFQHYHLLLLVAKATLVRPSVRFLPCQSDTCSARN